jgi:hypothetical protein
MTSPPGSNRLARHKKRNDGQDDRTGKSTQCTHLPSAETVSRVGGVTAGKSVGDGSYQEGGNMRPHVPAIRKHGHRLKGNASDNLNDHHSGQDANYDPRATFCNGRIVSTIVGVTPKIRIRVVH